MRTGKNGGGLKRKLFKILAKDVGCENDRDQYEEKVSELLSEGWRIVHVQSNPVSGGWSIAVMFVRYPHHLNGNDQG